MRGKVPGELYDLANCDALGQAGGLKQRPDAPGSHSIPRDAAEHRNGTRVRLAEAKEDTDGGRFASAVGAQQRDSFAPAHMEAGAVESTRGPEVFRDILEVDDGVDVGQGSQLRA
jgi:hypothetical protein